MDWLGHIAGIGHVLSFTFMLIIEGYILLHSNAHEWEELVVVLETAKHEATTSRKFNI